MSLFPIMPATAADPARGYPLENWTLGCGRQGLHMCLLRDQHAIATLWPWMRKQLMRLRSKNHPRTNWMPEHVRMQIMQGIAGQNAMDCFVAHLPSTDESPDTLHGVLIGYPLIDPFVQLPLTYHVWMGVIEPKILEALLPEFELLLKHRGFLSWQWTTSRGGWARRAKRFGAELVEYTIAKDLEVSDG